MLNIDVINSDWRVWGRKLVSENEILDKLCHGDCDSIIREIVDPPGGTVAATVGFKVDLSQPHRLGFT